MIRSGVTRFVLALLLGMGISSASWAIVLTDGVTDVGSVDLLLAQTQLPNSGDQTEEDWVNSIIAPDQVSYDLRIEDIAYQATELSTVFAAILSPYEPGYFIVKNSRWTALFDNVSDLNWAVFDTSLLNAGFKLPREELIISHISIFDGTAVPEPGVLGLLGIGLLGIVLGRRRMAA